MKEYDVTIPQWTVLKLLSVEDNLMQVEIANKIVSDIATVGSVIDRLVQKGYVQKLRTKKDRRAFCVSITEKGNKISNTIEEKALICNETALSGFSQKEIRELFDYLNRVSCNLMQETK